MNYRQRKKRRELKAQQATQSEQKTEPPVEIVQQPKPTQWRPSDLSRQAMSLAHGMIFKANLEGFYPVHLTERQLEEQFCSQGGYATLQQQACLVAFELMRSGDEQHKSAGIRAIETLTKSNHRLAVIEVQHSPYFIPDAPADTEDKKTDTIDTTAVIVPPSAQEISMELLKSGASDAESSRIYRESEATEFPSGLRVVGEPWEVVAETTSDGNGSTVHSNAG